MSAQHTPGPWFAADGLEPLGACLERSVMATDTFIAHVLFDDEDDAVAEANARLIAAAPELLEACQRALNFIENTEDEFGDNLPSGDVLRAAIAKARGEVA